MIENERSLNEKQKRKELINLILNENPELNRIIETSSSDKEMKENLKAFVLEYLEDKPETLKFYKFEIEGHDVVEKLPWEDLAAIRVLDYIDNSGKEIEDLNLRGKKIINDPFGMLWRAVKEGEEIGNCDFYEDMLYLFRQLNGERFNKDISEEKVKEWMDRHHSGLDERIIKLREKNKKRIIEILTKKIDSKEIRSSEFVLPESLSFDKKIEMVNEWWDDERFHLRFAIRSPDLLNELLDFTIDDKTLSLLYKAEKKGIPFFVNPYYLSLVNVNPPEFAKSKDLAIRYYVFYSEELVEEYGNIVAWEKEDEVEPGKPNAAGWILPTETNVHRRYPEVAILIPDTVGRACGGLCASCQRMYDFQRGNLNFNLEELKPEKAWDEKLKKIMKYWEEDSQLRGILVTGGDALMNSNESLKQIFDAIYEMALNKKEANKKRKDGEKYAEILRVRLGTRLLAYSPQRVTPELTKVLSDFKAKAKKIGIKQFVIQTHFQSAMEVTPESRLAVKKINDSGWLVTNQLVFTAAASRRGHTAKLRQVLNDIGVLPYYTFSVKGYRENSFKFATNARAVQEQIEEKVIGTIPKEYKDFIKKFPAEPENIVENINKLRKDANIPFMAIDRNVINLPAVGKSMTFSVIGITEDGRRILEFDHDHTRNHSPIIEKLGKITIVESKSIRDYLNQIEDEGDDPSEYESIWGYSIGETEKVTSIYEYSEYDFKVTDKITNFKD